MNIEQVLFKLLVQVIVLSIKTAYKKDPTSPSLWLNLGDIHINRAGNNRKKKILLVNEQTVQASLSGNNVQGLLDLEDSSAFRQPVFA